MARRSRTISICIHERAYQALRSLAEEKAQGTMSTLCLIVIYAELVKQGKMTFKEAEELLSA
jgi:hypothetical protein